MALFRIIDGQILSDSELRLPARGKSGPGHRTAVRSPLPGTDTGDEVPFAPIGIGKPLLVQIRHIYTGGFPRGGFFGTAGDVAVVSGVKDFDVFAASTRALNLVQREVSARSTLEGKAFDDGTMVVSYTPSLLKAEVKVTVEMAVAQFPAEFVASVTQALGQLQGLPLFLPYRGFLLGAEQLIGIAGDYAAALYDGPVFSQTEKLTFDLAGAAPAQAGFRLLANQGLEVDGMSFRDGVGLIDRDGTAYRGDEPYVVLSVDGREMPALASFAATAASTALLERFFSTTSATGASLEALVAGTRLLSDMKYRERAEAIARSIAAETNSARKAKLKAEREAVLRNILNEDLRP
jgi:hypothetical protein